MRKIRKDKNKSLAVGWHINDNDKTGFKVTV